MLENIDIATSAGVAGLTILIIEFAKKLYWLRSIKMYDWYPALMNLITLVIAFSLAGASYAAYGVDAKDAILNGILGFFLAVGGYEPIVNFIRSFFKKSKN